MVAEVSAELCCSGQCSQPSYGCYAGACAGEVRDAPAHERRYRQWRKQAAWGTRVSLSEHWPSTFGSSNPWAKSVTHSRSCSSDDKEAAQMFHKADVQHLHVTRGDTN
eukprot:4979536-Amphidinium_carterae.1